MANTKFRKDRKTGPRNYPRPGARRTRVGLKVGERGGVSPLWQNMTKGLKPELDEDEVNRVEEGLGSQIKDSLASSQYRFEVIRELLIMGFGTGEIIQIVSKKWNAAIETVGQYVQQAERALQSESRARITVDQILLELNTLKVASYRKGVYNVTLGCINRMADICGYGKKNEYNNYGVLNQTNVQQNTIIGSIELTPEEEKEIDAKLIAASERQRKKKLSLVGDTVSPDQEQAV